MRKIRSMIAEIDHFWYFEVLFLSCICSLGWVILSLRMIHWSNQFLIRHSTFNILRFSSIYITFQFWFDPLCFSFKKFWSNQWLLRYPTDMRSSSFQFSILVWFPKLKIKILERSNNCCSDMSLLKFFLFMSSSFQANINSKIWRRSS